VDESLSRYFPSYGIFRTKHEIDLFLIGTGVIGEHFVWCLTSLVVKPNCFSVQN